MKKKTIALTGSLSVILLFYLLSTFYTFPLHDNQFQQNGEAFGPINASNTLVQKIQAINPATITGVDLYFATYGKKLVSGTNNLEILINDQLVHSETFRSEVLEDTKFHPFKNMKIDVNAQDIITVKVSSDSSDGKITAWIKNSTRISPIDELLSYNPQTNVYTHIDGEVGIKIHQRISLFNYLSQCNYRVKPILVLITLLILPCIILLLYVLIKFFNEDAKE